MIIVMFTLFIMYVLLKFFDKRVCVCACVCACARMCVCVCVCACVRGMHVNV